MAWNARYWDLIDQLYWWPRYLGLRSIGRKEWELKDGMVCIPQVLINKSGPLYTRGRKIADTIKWLSGREEILNQILSLTFSIAPDVVLARAFLDPLGFQDSGPFDVLGRDVYRRYGWGADENVMQHDGLFVSPRSIVAVEIKLGAPTSPGQILKYLSLLAWEEMHSGEREQLGLLFVVPERALTSLWTQCGLSGPKIDRSFLERQRASPLPTKITDLLESDRGRLEVVLDRMKVAAISWRMLRDVLVSVRSTLDHSNPGDQTLIRLLDGFLAQLDVHEGTGL